MIRLKKLEEYLGFSVLRDETTLELGEPHNESVSYAACQRFWGREEGIAYAIGEASGIADMLIRARKDYRTLRYDNTIECLFSLMASLFYMKGDFSNAAGCLIKCLSIRKTDVTHWVELLFNLRAMGEFRLFEKGIFNFERLVRSWIGDSSKVLTQEKVIRLIESL